MITNSQIKDKAEELLAQRIANDYYLNDALCDCFAELRAIYAADSIDDKLAAIDAFKDKMDKSIYQPQSLLAEAYDILTKSAKLDDNGDAKREIKLWDEQ